LRGDAETRSQLQAMHGVDDTHLGAAGLAREAGSEAGFLDDLSLPQLPLDGGAEGPPADSDGRAESEPNRW
jgi:hypothetical protein